MSALDAQVVALLGRTPRRLRTSRAGYTGPSPREVFVFVHGWPDTSAVWSPLISQPALRFEREQRRCVLVDLPVWDGAAWQGEDLSFHRLGALLQAAIREEMASADVDAVTLVAHDWGVIIAALVLADAPQLVRRTVLCDIGASVKRVDSYRLACTWAFICAYFSTNAILFHLSRVPGLARVADAINAMWVPRLCGYGGDDYGRPLTARGNYFYWNAVALMSGGRGRLADAALRSPTQPLLFLHGTGIFHCHEWARGLRARDGCDAAYVCADHWFFRREPAKTARIIADWLDATAERAAGGGEARKGKRSSAAASAASGPSATATTSSERLAPVGTRRRRSPLPRSRY